MTFHIQTCVLLQKEGPPRPRPERLNKAPPGGDSLRARATGLQSAWSGRLSLVGSLTVAKKKYEIAALPTGTVQGWSPAPGGERGAGTSVTSAGREGSAITVWPPRGLAPAQTSLGPQGPLLHPGAPPPVPLRTGWTLCVHAPGLPRSHRKGPSPFAGRRPRCRGQWGSAPSQLPVPGSPWCPFPGSTPGPLATRHLPAAHGTSSPLLRRALIPLDEGPTLPHHDLV